MALFESVLRPTGTTTRRRMRRLAFPTAGKDRRQQQRLCHGSGSFIHGRFFATASTSTAVDDDKASSSNELDQILAEASFLTKSLYRSCLRSCRIIRYGNPADWDEFRRRQEQEELERARRRQQNETEDPRLAGLLSMLPPTDPEEELASRYEYYRQHTRETFFQASDCLSDVYAAPPPTTTRTTHNDAQNNPNNHHNNPKYDERHVLLTRGSFRDYFRALRRGEEHRRWLLQDLQFRDDPYAERFDEPRVQRLEQRAQVVTQRLTRFVRGSNNNHDDSDDSDDSDSSEDDSNNDAWDSDSDSDDDDD